MIQVTIRPASPADAPALAALAAATYADAFGYSFSAEDLAAHLARHLSAERFAQYVADDVVLVAEMAGGAAGSLVGYVQFGAAGAEYAPLDPGGQELRRLYVAREHQRQGIGTRLLAAALAHLQLQAANAVYLDVWEHNPGAIALYTRHGFQVIGARSFEVASGAETSCDLILVRHGGS